MSKAPLRFEYWKSNKNGQWYWRLKAGNNEPICQSEGYKSKASVVKVFHVLFDFQTMPVLVEINEEAYGKFKDSMSVDPKPSKKPKHYEGHINRQFP